MLAERHGGELWWRRKVMEGSEQGAFVYILTCRCGGKHGSRMQADKITKMDPGLASGAKPVGLFNDL